MWNITSQIPIYNLILESLKCSFLWNHKSLKIWYTCNSEITIRLFLSLSSLLIHVTIRLFLSLSSLLIHVSVIALVIDSMPGLFRPLFYISFVLVLSLQHDVSIRPNKVIKRFSTSVINCVGTCIITATYNINSMACAFSKVILNCCIHRFSHIY